MWIVAESNARKEQSRLLMVVKECTRRKQLHLSFIAERKCEKRAIAVVGCSNKEWQAWQESGVKKSNLQKRITKTRRSGVTDVARE